MTKIAQFKFIVLLFFCTSVGFAQKVKYKELFGLLSSKQYEQAEPFLKRYLKDNDDNPNAFLFMGIIFQEKASKNDVLKQTRLTIANMDSAIIFYDKAYKTITEKEIKRNDEYYQAYNRRDLRTGEFGVKLSDVQFDLEKKKEGLRERIDKVKMVKYYFVFADSLSKSSTALYKTIQDGYADEKQFYLRSDENLVAKLKALSVRFDSCTKMFDNYKNSASLLGKIGYNQALTLNDIKNFKKDGSSVADFYSDDIQSWDYKRFATDALGVIEKEVLPMRENLVNYDIEINKLREKMTHDSVSVKSDLTKLIEQLLLSQLKKFDPSPLPMHIFGVKIADLEYRSSLIEHKSFKDSADIKLHLGLIKSEMKSLQKLDSISEHLIALDMDDEVLNYNHFITNTFSNSIILKSYIKALNEYAEREKQLKTKELKGYQESLNWVINGLDSIPLAPVTNANRPSKFKPLITIEDKYTSGLSYTDSLSASGYFYNITLSHKPQIKVSYPVDKNNFKLRRLPYIKALSFSDAAGQIFFVATYSERAEKEKYPVSIAKIYKSDGLAWSTNYSFGFIPKNITFKSETGELTVTGDAAQVVIDKNGKMLK